MYNQGGYTAYGSGMGVGGGGYSAMPAYGGGMNGGGMAGYG
jgi:hypothetical protein